MSILDHPALRSVRSLVGHFTKPNLSDTEFLQQQLAVLEAYIEPFPADERDFRALAWIEANAKQYRHQWQQQSAAGRRDLRSIFWGWRPFGVAQATRFLHPNG
ncbi:MAG TPA: hypothetical protein DHV85_07950 [Candidatus Accumulibacter sp.]|nr:hypothetical protein [Accumulibacter sp.]